MNRELVIEPKNSSYAFCSDMLSSGNNKSTK